MYMCRDTCSKGFRFYRALVGVDERHLKGSYGGHFLTAIGIDANDGINPIAYAIVEGETRGSWS